VGHSIEGLVNRVAIEGRNPGTPTISRPSDQTVVGIAGENSKNPLGTDTGILTLRVLKYFSTGFMSMVFSSLLVEAAEPIAFSLMLSDSHHEVPIFLKEQEIS